MTTLSELKQNYKNYKNVNGKIKTELNDKLNEFCVNVNV